MTAELGGWLDEFCESEPATAAEVGAALVAVLESAEPSGVAIVGQPGQPAAPVSDDPRETVDSAYQQQLEELQRLRRRVADAANRRHETELRLSEGQAAGANAAELDGLADQLAAARRREAGLAHASQRIQLEVDAYRTAKETAKVRYTAAEAMLRVAEAIEAAGGDPDPDLAQRRDDLRKAEERLVTLRPARAETAARRGAVEPVAGLLELRADPLGSDTRILFAAEPADTVTLLAVLEGLDAVSRHGTEAISLAGDLLTEVRDEGWPADIDEIALTDPAEFLERFFPADDGSIADRASVLAAMTSVGALRADRRMTVDEVAARSGLSRLRVEAIERDGLRTAQVYEAVALARVLGARLDLSAGSGPVAG